MLWLDLSSVAKGGYRTLIVLERFKVFRVQGDRSLIEG